MKTLASHPNTSYFSDFPDVLAQLIFFHNAQVTLDDADVIGCHLFSLVAWFQRGKIDEVGGGRKNTELLTKNKDKVAEYITTLMFVGFHITDPRCGVRFTSAGKGMDPGATFFAHCQSSRKYTNCWVSKCRRSGQKVCRVLLAFLCARIVGHAGSRPFQMCKKIKQGRHVKEPIVEAIENETTTDLMSVYDVENGVKLGVNQHRHAVWRDVIVCDSVRTGFKGPNIRGILWELQFVGRMMAMEVPCQFHQSMTFSTPHAHARNNNTQKHGAHRISKPLRTNVWSCEESNMTSNLVGGSRLMNGKIAYSKSSSQCALSRGRKSCEGCLSSRNFAIGTMTELVKP